MKSWAFAVALAGLLLCCCVAHAEDIWAEDCPDRSNPVKCLKPGEMCMSKWKSQCKEGLTCAVAIGRWSVCVSARDHFPECGNPPVHCKNEGDSCALASHSQCKQTPVKLHCDKATGLCVRGKAPKNFLKFMLLH
jgi:hypothetical protein